MHELAKGKSTKKLRLKNTAKKRTDLSNELIDSLNEAADIMAGTRAPSRTWKPPAAVNVRAIRARTGLSQPDFARRFGFTAAAARDWEQGRRQPEAAARVLLLVIASRPEVVEEVLAASMPHAA